jgi:NADH-quinone oxidoreductase subunit G
VRPLWQVISDISSALGHDEGVHISGAQASAKLFATVPFFEGLTLDEIGGRGVRWPERHDFVSPAWEPAKLEIPAAAPPAQDGALRLGTWRPLWANKDVDVSPILHFARARQIAELAPADAETLGIREGDRVRVRPGHAVGTGEAGDNGGRGSSVEAGVKLRSAIPTGTVFLAEATKENPVNVLTGALVTIERVAGASWEPSAVPQQLTPAAEGLSEMPASAPLPIPPRELT